MTAQEQALEQALKQVLLLDLLNIELAAREIHRQVLPEGFVWDEELFEKVRDLREEIIHLL